MAGKRKKSQKARDNQESATLSELLRVAEGHLSQNGLLAEISRRLCIPDYTKACGLRQCHEEFGSISAKLQQVFTGSREYQADNVSADKLAATIIIAIYEQMGQVDTILRKRIFDESDVSNIPRRQLVRTIVFFKDFLKHATTLLHSDIARRIVMPTLSQVTHFNDIKILRDLSRFTSTILSCVEGQLNDLGYVESGVCVLSHSTSARLESGPPRS
ncbi:hypothetical protein C8J57DRAFT_1535086 [Mycena rebaudengoi]|nr:hypothetical protein C8J57DRAFT_1535086 [Mycena rebaudengoi]